MAVFDFLISFILASQYHNKAKTSKALEKTVLENRKNCERNKETCEEIMKSFGNEELEEEVWRRIDADGENLLRKYIKMTPSYDKNKPYNMSLANRRETQGANNRKILSKLLLSEEGCINSLDITAGMSFPVCVNEYCASQYEKQIMHELLIMWEEKMHEHGFPFNYVVNNKETNSYDFLGNIPDMAHAVPISQSKYEFGNRYFWDIYYNRKTEN